MRNSAGSKIRKLEEERRLAHVAVTRAQKRLVITYVRGFTDRVSEITGKPLDAAFQSRLSLPAPLLPEGTPGAAMWLRVSPWTVDEPAWTHECRAVTSQDGPRTGCCQEEDEEPVESVAGGRH